MKVCEKEFPKGSYKGQKTDGYHIDDYRKEAIDIMAKKIVNDMQFVGIYAGSGTVRNGKSTISQQDAYYFTQKVNELHNLNNTFTIKNVVFSADDLIKRAFEVPSCSVLILDEGDDLTEQHFSVLARKLRKFFRKCGQLNLLIILILPDFFELPKHYAITRSNYLVNVSFQGEFDRGFFDFYSFKRKKTLYLKGKKLQDYEIVKPNFDGRFPPCYTVDLKAYSDKKRRDLKQSNEDDKPRIQLEKEIRMKLFRMVHSSLKNVSIKTLAHAFGIGERTAYVYLCEEEEQQANH